MIDILQLITSISLLSLAVEAITEIITSSDIMSPLRQWIKDKAYTYPPSDNTITRSYAWLDKLISCGYCTSVWISGALCIWSDIKIVGYAVIDTVIVVFAVHRLSNWLHVAYELIRKGRVGSMEVDVRLKDVKDGTNGEGSAEGTAEA